jgi:hypothetical protein
MTVAAHLRMRQVGLYPEPEIRCRWSGVLANFGLEGMLEMHDSSVILVRKFCLGIACEGTANFRIAPSFDWLLLKVPETMT